MDPHLHPSLREMQSHSRNQGPRRESSGTSSSRGLGRSIQVSLLKENGLFISWRVYLTCCRTIRYWSRLEREHTHASMRPNIPWRVNTSLWRWSTKISWRRRKWQSAWSMKSKWAAQLNSRSTKHSNMIIFSTLRLSSKMTRKCTLCWSSANEDNSMATSSQDHDSKKERLSSISARLSKEWAICTPWASCTEIWS